MTKSSSKSKTLGIKVNNRAHCMKQNGFRADSKQTASLIEAGKSAAKLAIRESKALGLPIVYIEDGILYRESSNGRRRRITSKKDKIPD